MKRVAQCIPVKALPYPKKSERGWLFMVFVRFTPVKIEKHTDIHGRGGDTPLSVKLKNVSSLVGGGVYGLGNE